MSDSDSDEWEDVSDSVSVPLSVSKTIENVELPRFGRVDRESLSETLPMVNVVIENGVTKILRCEPAAKKYPGLQLSPYFQNSDAVLLSIHLHNATEDVISMRVPDFKTTGLDIIRRNGSVFIKQPKLASLHFKKKCQDKKTGQDIAFELGKGFLSHTGGIDAQFMMVMIPFNNGRLEVERASRTCKFYVYSKRQSRYMPKKRKRHKKNTEILKLETNIREAAITLSSLEQDLVKIRYSNQTLENAVCLIRQHTSRLPDGPVKIALVHATRRSACEEVACL